MADRQQAEEWTPRTWDELFPGRFLKHSHLAGKEVEVTIERVYNTTIDDKIAQVARLAPVPGCEQRDWGLNKTNGLCLRAMFGDTIRDWFGKRVVLKESVVEHGREKGKPCIRICASPDIHGPLSVVIDFHTKRIKPFVIKVRGPAGKPAMKQEASPKAKALAERVRHATTPVEFGEIMNDLEEYLVEDEITKDEAAAIMAGIEKKQPAEKAASNVIT